MSTPARFTACRGIAIAELSGWPGAAVRSRRGPDARGARPLVIGLTICLGLAACGGNAPRAGTSLQEHPCTVHYRAARCGTVTVPEGRLTGKGRQIKIRFVVFPASGRGSASRVRPRCACGR